MAHTPLVFPVPLRDEPSFTHWEVHVPLVLATVNLSSHLQDNPPPTPAANTTPAEKESYNKWLLADMKVRGALLQSIDLAALPRLRAFFTKTATARSVWDSVCAYFAKSTPVHQVELCQQLDMFAQPSDELFDAFTARLLVLL